MLGVTAHCDLPELSHSLRKELWSQEVLVQIPALPLSSCVTTSKLLNLSEPQSPQREMIASPIYLPGLVRRLNEIMQPEQLAFCRTHRRRSVNEVCDYSIQGSTSKSIAVSLRSLHDVSPVPPPPPQETQLSRILSLGLVSTPSLKGQGSHTGLGTNAGSISSQRKEQRPAFP